MDIKFQVVALADGYALDMFCDMDDDHMDHNIRLQSGYRSVEQAMQALHDCLTIAPPDMAVYDEAVGHVGRLVDAQAEASEAIGQMLQRVTDCEDAIRELSPAPEPRRQNPLLAGRAAAAIHMGQGAAPQDVPPPPPIRRERPVVPHQPSGGVVGKYREQEDA